MSISLKEFKEGNFHKRESKITEEHPVLLFLKKNKRAYNVKEIAKAVKMKENSVRSILRKFRKKKLVEQKIPFYAYKK